MEEEKIKCSILLFIVGVVLIIYTLATPGCSHSQQEVDVKTWSGDSKKGSILRLQDNVTISCSDPRFDQMACFSYYDLHKIFSSLAVCKE